MTSKAIYKHMTAMPHCLIAEMFASTKIYVLDLKKENVKHRGPAIKVHML